MAIKLTFDYGDSRKFEVWTTGPASAAGYVEDSLNDMNDAHYPVKTIFIERNAVMPNVTENTNPASSRANVRSRSSVD